jgi:HAD superfamily hydrolase (TIGR01509 family)
MALANDTTSKDKRKRRNPLASDWEMRWSKWVLRALIFDFDGMIVDTETPEFTAWQSVFRAHECDLHPLDWVHCIGTHNALDPHKLLEEKSGRVLDRAEIRTRQHEYLDELLSSVHLCAGVADLIVAARHRGLKLAVASSSSRRWVLRWLDQFKLTPYFDVFKNRDDVEKVKPDPALYLQALAELQVSAQEAIAFEDSLNGLRAARAAGIFTVVVPNAMTRHLTLDEADMMLDSLEKFSLDHAAHGGASYARLADAAGIG